MFSWFGDDEIDKIGHKNSADSSVFGAILPVDRIFCHNQAHPLLREIDAWTKVLITNSVH